MVLRELIKQVESPDRSDWIKQVGGWREEFPFTYDRDDPMLLPQHVIETIYEMTGGDAVITTEVGQHQMWAAHFYKYTKPRTFLSSGGLGTMGYGLPAAIGAQAGARDKIVVDIGGDGSSQMNFQEVVVAVEHGLPVKIVILNNGHLGMVRQWQEMFYNREYSSSVLGPSGRGENERLIESEASLYLPDFVKLAEAHGALGLRVEDKGALKPTLERAFSENGPAVVECVVKPEENVYPMVPPGASLMEMVQSMA
ncbi:thiamine pyrophosphate-dependent enzyme, partial [Verrucomicrobiota bacterium]